MRWRPAVPVFSSRNPPGRLWVCCGGPMNRCPRCKETKTLSDFQKNRSTPDGRQGWCRICQNQAGRRYKKTDRGRASLKRTRTKHPDHVRAKNAVTRAVHAGKIPRATALGCTDCSRMAEHYHHESYAPGRWLDVDPLCMQCHTARHHRPAAEILQAVS